MNKIRSIAIYLPQFHPIPENDEAWGEGFTEWTNVKKAKPLFDGHYQPHVPHESVGYYDLRDTGVLARQAEMARAYGIYGFAYYHYWFNGKRLLNEPLDKMLEDKHIDFPFCYIWANENWTRRWDGQDDDIIIKQEYSSEDDLNHIRFLCRNVFSDKRYITVDGKPLFFVYRIELLPDCKETARLWREEAKGFGFKDLYLVKVENFDKSTSPEDIGFDAALSFAPDWECARDVRYNANVGMIDYRNTVYNTIIKKKEYKCFRSVFPGWDNTPRRKELSGSVFIKNEVEMFKYFLEAQLSNTLKEFQNPEEQLIFINAWNEWGEGCHIEPDVKNGTAYLEICRDARPAAQSDFESFCAETISKLRPEFEKLKIDYESLKRKYNHTLNTKYYRFGKSIITGIRRTKKWLGFL